MKNYKIFVYAIALMFAAGCGGTSPLPTVPVTGKVSLDGQPLEGAVVTFNSTDPTINSGTGTTDKLGVYSASTSALNTGLMPGKYKVVISHLVGNDGKPVQAQEGMDAEQLRMQGMAKENLPATVSDPQLSTLEVEVKAGSAPHDFDLKSSAN